MNVKSRRNVFLTVALACLALLAFALYLQVVEEMQPCPLCIIQRYFFMLVAAFALAAAFLPERAGRVSVTLATLAATAGAATAIWHLYVRSHPSVSCSIDPLETALNQLPTARLWPQMFIADGLCSAPWPPILGLQIPTWSLIWFAILGLALVAQGFKPVESWRSGKRSS